MPNYPGALDSLSNPTSATNMNDAGFLHSVQHGNVNDIIELLEQKLGITDVPAADTPVANRVLTSLANGKSGWGQITSGMLGAEAVTHLGLANGATGAPTINAPNPGLLTDMQIGYTPTGGKVLMLFTGTFFASGAATITVYAYKDNVGLGQQRAATVPNGSSYVTISLVHQFTPAAAPAAFQIYWSVSTGSATADGTSRQLTLLEIKA